jgi:hypothetical protein
MGFKDDILSVRDGWGMTDDIQEYIDIDDLEGAIPVRYLLYNENIDAVYESHHYEEVTNKKIHDGELSPISMYTPPHYGIYLDKIIKAFDRKRLKNQSKALNQRDALAGLLTLGTVKIQHDNNRIVRTIEKAKLAMADIDADRTITTFIRPKHKILTYTIQKKNRRKSDDHAEDMEKSGGNDHFNAYVPTNEIIAPISRMSKYLYIKDSEIGMWAFSTAMLTWEDIPETAIPFFKRDVELFEAHIYWLENVFVPSFSS